MNIQSSESGQGFSTLLWIGGPAVEAAFDYCEKQSVRPLDLFAALLPGRLRDQYGAKNLRESVATVDYSRFNQFRIAYLRKRLMDVDFSHLQMLRTRNRKRDRAIAQEVQVSLEGQGWKKYRSTPNSLGATFMIEPGARLEMQLNLPHGSLQFEYALWCGDDRLLWREFYLSWFGLGGFTEVWGSAKDPANLGAFIVEQTRKLQEFLESCRE